MQCARRSALAAYGLATRHYGSSPTLPSDFLWFPHFFDWAEQRVLLSAALQKLDASEPRIMRKRRREFLASQPRPARDTDKLTDAFLPDELYDFQEGHYDGVIRRFREMHVSSWDEEKDPVLGAALGRLRTLYPNTRNTQTHLLHLASNGEIHPHVDNTGASGSWILGVSLGSERILRMEPTEGDARAFDVCLPSGSVYVQKDAVRYQYKHSILHSRPMSGEGTPHGQRLSIMVRDRHPPAEL
ncbi:hypothetical protein BC834DRAFT_220743 [Gloeopeniophorella convolvens]|nr:hypothetical protein BC834DRAFT_220743 [Gloeopeniophorella convolvens]